MFSILQKVIACFLIYLLILPVFPGEIFALSGNNIVALDNYPGKMDIKNINGLGKNISNDFFAGAMTFQYPLAFPSGSRGISPNLMLSYSSNNSDAFSPYGYGFSLSIPRIQRSVKKGVSELYAQDEFVFGGQDLVGVPNTTNQFRSKDMSDMSLYTRTASGGWTQNFTNGQTRRYGMIPSSRIADPDNQNHIYAWLLDEESDGFGHMIQYQYTLDGGQPYLTTVKYGYDPTNSNPLYQIRFEYIAKTASLTSYRTQFEVSTKKLLSKITLVVDNIPVRGYECLYDTIDTPISHLKSIGEFSASGEKLPNSSFSYGEGQYQHMIVAIDNHRGGRALFQYAPSTGYRNASGALQNQNLPFIVQTLAKQTLIDSVTGVNSTEAYSYSSGHYYYDSGDIWGREYVGFARVSIQDEKSEKTLYFHQSQTASPDPLKYQDHIAKKGRLYRTDIRDIVSGKILSREIVRYDMKISGDGRWLVFPTYKISSTFDTDVSHKDTAISYLVDDMGNVTHETQYGWVKADIENGTFTDIAGDTITIDRTYLSNITKNLYGFLSAEKIYGFSGELIRSNIIEYDNMANGVAAGLPTAKIRKDVISNQESRETTVYSLGGIPIQKIDALGNTTIYTYDNRDISLIHQTNPLGWNIDYSYNYSIGKLTNIRDQNNTSSRISYDIWGREVSRSQIYDGGEAGLVTHTYDDISIPNISTEKVFYTAEDDFKVTSQYMDGWGRTIATITSTEKPGQYSSSQTRYDNRGNPIYLGYPVFVGNTTWNAGLVLSGVTVGEAYRNLSPGVSYTYDPLDRILTQRDARGLTQKSYTPDSESTTNALGITNRNVYDAFRNLISVSEDLNGKPTTTRYLYDALGRPIGLYDALNNTRSWKYDGLGRLMMATDTHAPGDTSYGIRGYEYDLSNRLVSYTTANGEKITYTYDPLSRVIDESYVSGGVWSRKYTYDQGARSLGTLSRISDPSTDVAYTYDALGRQITENRTIGSSTYAIRYQYNTASILTSVLYPNLGKVDYIYKLGYIQGIDYTDPTGNKTSIIPDISYTPNATMKSIRYGNGVLRTTVRDPNYNYRLTNSTVSLSGSILLNTDYRYDAISNIDTIQEKGIEPLRKSLDYTYDSFGRLTRANYVYAMAGYNHTNIPYTYTYDDIGNIIGASTVGTYEYSNSGYANPHAVTTAGDTTYGYNQAGQTISRTSPSMVLSFAYSPYGEMTVSRKNGIETTYAYDSTHRRILKSTPGLTEHHVIDGYEVEYESGAIIATPGTSTGSTNTGSIVGTASPNTITTTSTHIMLGDERIATFQSQTDNAPKMSNDDTLIYHISDHLNSSSLDLSNTGLLLQATDYLPFGKSNTYEVISKRIQGKKGGYINKYQFANKQLDSESDLQYFEKRYYDNRIGRFTTEDPVYWEVGRTKRPNPYFTDPQNWNSYSYVRNNPINLVDPTGESPTDDISNMLWQVYNAGYTNVMNDLKSETKSYQQAITTIAQNVPGTGDIGDAYALVTGKDLYSGEDVSGINQALAGAAFIIPGVSGSEVRAGKSMFAGIASKIADGHAFTKHIGEFEDLGIRTKDQLANFAEGIMKKANNTDNMRNLENGRKAYFDNKTRTIVITNPNAKDAGTIFRPSTGKDYFLNTKNLK